MAGGSEAFSPKLTRRFGYRYGSVDCDKTDRGYDVGNAGVFIGSRIRWKAAIVGRTAHQDRGKQ